MSEHPGRLTRVQQQERTRERLIEAAADVFAEHGFEGASIDEITARAGFSRGAFYSNFTDKTDLLVTLSDRRVSEYAAEVLPRILATPPDQRLSELARWLAAERPPSEVLLIIELARQRDHSEETAAALDRVVGRVLAAIEDMLGVEGGDLEYLPQEERKIRARAALAAVLGIELFSHLGVPADAKTIEVLLAGVASQESIHDGPAAPSEAGR